MSPLKPRGDDHDSSSAKRRSIKGVTEARTVYRLVLR